MQRNMIKLKLFFTKIKTIVHKEKGQWPWPLHQSHSRVIYFQGPVHTGDGILIFGLYLDGARWDIEQKCLRDSRPGQRFSRLPELVLQPSQVSRTVILNNKTIDGGVRPLLYNNIISQRIID